MWQVTTIIQPALRHLGTSHFWKVLYNKIPMGQIRWPIFLFFMYMLVLTEKTSIFPKSNMFWILVFSCPKMTLITIFTRMTLQQVYLKYNLSSIQTNWSSFQTTYHNKCNPVYTKKCNAVPRQECKTTYYNNCLALSCNRWQLFNRYHNKCQKNQVCKTSYSKKCTKVELHFQFFIIWYLDLNFDKLFMFFRT